MTNLKKNLKNNNRIQKTEEEKTNQILNKLLNEIKEINKNNQFSINNLEEIVEKKSFDISFFSLENKYIISTKSDSYPTVGEIILLDNFYINKEINESNIEDGLYTKKQIEDFVKSFGEHEELPFQIIKVSKHYACCQFYDEPWMEDLHVYIKFNPEYSTILKRNLLIEKTK